MNRAIITGATGAIGTALIKELVSRNIEVLVFTRKESKRNKNILKNKLVKTKYCSLNDTKNCINDTGKEYDVFFHLAWAGASGVGRNDKELQEKNVEYALDAVECAKRFGCRKFIGIGSQAEYGRTNEILKESTPTNPENEYGKAKLKAGILTKQKALDLGLDFNWIRVLSIYGPNDGENTLISYAIKQFIKNEELNVTKCEQEWDYLNSKDAANAIYLVAEKGKSGKTYVLGSGEHNKLSYFVEKIKDVTKSKSTINYGAKEYPDNQVMYLTSDVSDLKEDVGWKPNIDFENGIKNIIKESRKETFLQFIKFCFVGCSNTFISLLVYYLFIYIDKKLYLLGSIAGFFVSVLNSFYWNNKYVFSGSGENIFKKLIKTYLSYGSTSILSLLLLYIEVDILGVNEMIAPIINIAIKTPINFIINKFWAFGKKK